MRIVSERPRILDLFCGAGGAAMGLHRAGFKPYGIDNKPQPRYPYAFLQMDAIEALNVLLDGGGLTFSNGETLYLVAFAAYWASPPCQHYSWAAARWRNSGYEYPDLITESRDGLLRTGKPYVIENVVGAPMIEPITLCGSSFGLRVRRHRLFEATFLIWALPCSHRWQNEDPLWSIRQRYRTIKTGVCYVFGNQEVGQTVEDWKLAMGIDWMGRQELSQAIPPAYSEYIGRHLLRALADRATKGNAPAGTPGR